MHSADDTTQRAPLGADAEEHADAQPSLDGFPVEAPAEGEEIDYRALYERAEREKSQFHEKALRYAAECENVRRRSEKEKANARDYAIESFARDMTEAMENLYRALESVEGREPTADVAASLLEGVETTKKDVAAAFERCGVRRIFPKGEAFDHNFHQAVAQTPTDEAEAGTVLEVFRSGYVIKDRLLRPAMVAVATAKA
ncbi:MAG: nucleotide exchange factor GrpE [Rickettsiales bacterium]